MIETQLNDESQLRQVFDEWYEVFWRAELGGQRLQKDLGLICTLGEVTPTSEIIDLACAFGRITNALAASGYHVTGIDASLPLLESARAVASAQDIAVKYVHSDWRSLSLEPIYDCALLWFTSFGYLSEYDNFAVLGKSLGCLRPSGRLLIETRHWDSMRREFEPITVRSADENFLIEYHSYEAERGVQWTRQILLVNGRRLERQYGIRRYTFAEMRSLCLRAGFKDVKAYSDLGKPLQSDSRRCVLVARK